MKNRTIFGRSILVHVPNCAQISAVATEL